MSSEHKEQHNLPSEEDPNLVGIGEFKDNSEEKKPYFTVVEDDSKRELRDDPYLGEFEHDSVVLL